MRKILPSVLLLLPLTVATLTSCDKAKPKPSDPVTVQYKVAKVGDADITGITYRDENGNLQTVVAESLDLTLEVLPGFEAFLEVEGDIMNGAVKADLDVDQDDVLDEQSQFDLFISDPSQLLNLPFLTLIQGVFSVKFPDETVLTDVTLATSYIDFLDHEDDTGFKLELVKETTGTREASKLPYSK